MGHETISYVNRHWDVSSKHECGDNYLFGLCVTHIGLKLERDVNKINRTPRFTTRYQNIPHLSYAVSVPSRLDKSLEVAVPQLPDINSQSRQ